MVCIHSGYIYIKISLRSRLFDTFQFFNCRIQYYFMLLMLLSFIDCQFALFTSCFVYLFWISWKSDSELGIGAKLELKCLFITFTRLLIKFSFTSWLNDLIFSICIQILFISLFFFFFWQQTYARPLIKYTKQK